jgi:polyvinyl alcohol dehydrogenase (cytochrome)
MMKGGHEMKYWMRMVGIVGVLALLLIAASISKQTSYAKSGDWPTYMGDTSRSGFNAAETMINPTSAHNLKLHWKLKAGGKVTTQPVVANGLVYWGSWDGYEHATNPTTGKDAWAVNLGQSSPMCSPKTHNGVLSSAAFASLAIGGVKTPVIFVGGGDANLYALNANTGAMIWHTSLGAVSDHFLYGSLAFYKGSIYIGVSSHGDCPLEQGQLVQLRATTGKIQHTFNVVPAGCIGGSVWVAPTIDAATGIIYFGTGNGGTCSTSETMAVALVAVRASDLSFVSSWQVPSSQQGNDSDFGSTATLFTATIKGIVHQMVGLLNKNGIYYAFDRNALSNGPLWQVQLAAPAMDMENNVSSSAWDGSQLYISAASTTIHGSSCAGSIRALKPASGAFNWEDCLSADVLGPVTAVPGVAEVGSGTSFILVDTQTGAQLFNFQDTGAGSQFMGPGSIANGVLYHGNTDGYLYAFGL